MSCTLSDLGDAKCDLSHTNGSPHLSFSKCPSEGSDDHESYFHKGYEEDVPSDSTAVLSPEVNRSHPRGGAPLLSTCSFFRICRLVDQQLSSLKAMKRIQWPDMELWMWSLSLRQRSSSCRLASWR